MPEEAKLSKVEHLKESSRQLRGTIAEELASDNPEFSHDAYQLLKHHGTYQQDDRDARHQKSEDGTPAGKSFICMVRTRIPGGKLTADQLLAELDLCDRLGNGTLRATSRQGLQLHYIVKNNLHETIRTINQVKLTTFCACGDVERNVMCCPAPYKHNKVRQQMQEMADRVAEHLKPKSTAYYDIWVRDQQTGEEYNAAEWKPVEEPIYGTRYLPRKFKTAFALPEDNCVDIYANDLGFLAIVENDEIIGYNVLVGGSMGMKPSLKKTFPAVAKRMTFVTPDQVIPVAEAVVKVQRDFGNREDRQQARMKYLIANWGLPKFKAKVEEYYGGPLPEPHAADVTDVDDHMGWHEQGDGRFFLGIDIQDGRIKDDEHEGRIKSGLRAILQKYRMNVRLTPLCSVILCDIEEKDRADIEQMLRDYGIEHPDNRSLLRRYSMACVALPTCGLAVTESERIMPELLDHVEAEWARYGFAKERLSIHVTGCPNGCARPYTPDIGLVGKAQLKYTLYLGGHTLGTRIGFIYRDMVHKDEVAAVLAPLFAYYKADRKPGESFGDFCHRKGQQDLEAYAQGMESAA